jgi:hypothetical protein
MVVRACPVSVLVRVTVTFGTAAADGSVTVPAKAPVLGVWAEIEAIVKKTKATIKHARESVLAFI